MDIKNRVMSILEKIGITREMLNDPIFYIMLYLFLYVIFTNLNPPYSQMLRNCFNDAVCMTVLFLIPFIPP